MKSIIKIMIVTVITSQLTVGQAATIEAVETDQYGVTFVTSEGGRHKYDSQKDLIKAVQGGVLTTKDVLAGIDILEAALKRQEWIWNAKKGFVALGVASLFLFSTKARYWQGYKDNIVKNESYTRYERTALHNMAAANEAQSMKSLVVYGLPATLLSVIALLTPSDIDELSRDLVILRGSLYQTEQIEGELRQMKELE